MKIYFRYILFFVMAILMFSCHSDREEDGDTPLVDTLGVGEYEANGMIWSYDPSVDTLVRMDTTQIRYTIAQLVDILNAKYEGKVVLEATGQAGDSLFVSIDTATYLTQQMGSAGARAYMAEATYTLTEGDGVRFVVFDFEEGDHAVPGTYTRETFVRNPNATRNK